MAADFRVILVVEDNDVSREGFANVLRRAGYGVMLAADGREASNLLQSGESPDLVLLDMLMPVLDGWQFLKWRAARPQPAVPVIITTGTNLSSEWARDHGCQGFLRKPIETAALLEEVGRCLG